MGLPAIITFAAHTGRHNRKLHQEEEIRKGDASEEGEGE